MVLWARIVNAGDGQIAGTAAEGVALSGMVFDIQKFSIHDGPGIRTTVFLKGCPLRCVWCHNPESQDGGPEISFSPSKCIGCGFCRQACPHGCHTVDAEGRRVFVRASCERCGRCAAGCYAGALEVIGRPMTVTAVLDEVLKDRPFYETSGGGMTISGGEPLAQFEFTRALLAAARREGLHTCIETSGFASFDRLAVLAGLVDLFYYDYKETDPARHLEYTGVPLSPILENLAGLDRLGAATVLRCPIMPGLNARDEHFRGIAAVANGLSHMREVHILSYHPLGRDKLARIGRTGEQQNWGDADNGMVQAWVDAVAGLCRLPVKRP